MSIGPDEQERDLLRRVNSRHRLWSHADAVTVLARRVESTTFAIGGCIVRHADGDAVSREATLLAALASAGAVLVPTPLVHEAALGVLITRRLPGTPVIGRVRRDPGSLPRALIETLIALRRIGGSVGLPADPYPNDLWHADAVEQFRAVRGQLPGERIRLLEEFLEAAPPPTRTGTVPQHNDLGAEHVLVDDAGRVTGIVDWADAALADPARDLGSIFRDFGENVARGVAAGLGIAVTEAEFRRIVFHARCKWIEDVAFAVQDPERRADYLANADRTFAHTFAATR
ncbi:aminoglycoside phosphotransferase family protein [Microbacterium sp. NPDC058345]|uniref:aminoglycoside phosphotransferase family protein n=1 Tax=Microbacterium sp. NPDC058345 TaxID=3346455 RepID=UPI00365B274F